jgi:hypothetical protein
MFNVYKIYEYSAKKLTIANIFLSKKKKKIHALCDD